MIADLTFELPPFSFFEMGGRKLRGHTFLQRNPKALEIGHDNVPLKAPIGHATQRR
jgi:hypothetical protein